MCDSARIQREVERFVAANELFTSVDIANAIKTGGPNDKPEWIRNRDVAAYLRDNVRNIALQVGKNYEATPSPVTTDRGTTLANLYHPINADLSDYADYAKSSQKAITPDEFAVIEAVWTGTVTVKPLTLSIGPSKPHATLPTGPNQYTQFQFPSVP